MPTTSAFARTAALIGDPARASMLTALADGRALTASELARHAGVTPQTASGHLARMVEAGLLGMQMYRHDSQFYGGDGIVVKGVENTIRAVSSIARDGMRETDNEIIRLMIGEETVK